MPSSTDDTTDGERTMHRRGVLASLAGVATVGGAGCATILDAVADLALEDVNVFNESSRPVSGTIEITGPEGSTLLQERYDLEAKPADEAKAEATAAYPDIWQTPGSHRIVIELADGVSFQGQSRVDTTVTVADVDEDMLAVAFGSDQESEGIYLAVADSFTQFT